MVRVVRTHTRAGREPGASREVHAGKGLLPATQMGALDGSLWFCLQRAHDAVQRALEGGTGHAMAPARYAALMVIDCNPGIAQGTLGRAIGRDKSSVTPLVAALVENGWVKRMPSQSDRRVVQLFMTPAGRRTVRQWQRHVARHEVKLDRLLAKDKRRVMAALTRIAAAFD
jgi:DNA-binding MarR family transcriptional regulator